MDAPEMDTPLVDKSKSYDPELAMLRSDISAAHAVDTGLRFDTLYR